MKLGLALPQRYGVDLQRDVVKVAKLAEEQGFDSVWVGERPTFAAPGSEGLYGIPGLPWPEAYKGMCEPLTAMAAAAAVTERVRIGSSVLVPALHHPGQLAAALATIDQLSGGRVVAGIGSGWATPTSMRSVCPSPNATGCSTRRSMCSRRSEEPTPSSTRGRGSRSTARWSGRSQCRSSR
jgi:alkanesulfonate monooxygenase SsuD/methylene tetrahydromethanopterin reductase-like flavin-dependent oxidoreductase (luciferase family)